MSETTFKTKDNVYEFLAMPFTLTNALSPFMGLMIEVS
jgi:hypothetical protein